MISPADETAVDRAVARSRASFERSCDSCDRLGSCVGACVGMDRIMYQVVYVRERGAFEAQTVLVPLGCEACVGGAGWYGCAACSNAIGEDVERMFPDQQLTIMCGHVALAEC